MNKTQESAKNMYMRLRSLINSISAAIIATMPQFQAWYDAWNDQVDTLTALIEVQQRDRKGKAVVKAERRDLLTILGMDICLKIRSYATAIGDMDLYNTISYTKTSLDRFTEVDFIAAITTILNSVTLLQPNLVGYGITALTVTEYDALFNAYLTSAPLPQATAEEKREATAAIKVAIRNANALLKKMDGVVSTLILSNRPFFNQYFGSRTLIKLPSSTIVVRGQVIDQDGNPLPFVTMKCEALGTNRKVSAKGGFLIRHAENGVYEFIFTRTGYETVTVSINVYNSVRTDVLVTMHLHV